RLVWVGVLIRWRSAQHLLRVLERLKDELVRLVRIARILPRHRQQLCVEGTHFDPITLNTSSALMTMRRPSSYSTISRRASTSCPSTRACPLLVTMRDPAFGNCC